MPKISADDQALDAVQQMKRIIEGSLSRDIEDLNRQGTVLSEPEHWSGPRADDFRNDWQEMHRSLMNAREAVEQLRARADKITNDIMIAGGFGG